jgi:acetyl esterase
MPDDRLPLVIFAHGGGWCIGDVASYDVAVPRTRQRLRVARCCRWSTGSRPSIRFPAAPEDDARLAFDWSVDNADLLGMSTRRASPSPATAPGGNLAIVTALALRARRTRSRPSCC